MQQMDIDWSAKRSSLSVTYKEHLNMAPSEIDCQNVSSVDLFQDRMQW